MAENTLLEKVLSLQDKYKQLEASLADPEVIADMKKFVQLNKDYKQLQPIIQAGFMEGSKLKYAGTHAYVWSSTDFGEGNAHLLYMKVNTRLQVGCYFECCYGHNIRPVSD